MVGVCVLGGGGVGATLGADDEGSLPSKWEREFGEMWWCRVKRTEGVWLQPRNKGMSKLFLPSSLINDGQPGGLGSAPILSDYWELTGPIDKYTL